MTKRIVFRGTVQGVGFRPFVWRVADSFGLKGFVRNIGNGVEAVFCGESSAIQNAIEMIRTSPPPQAIIESVEVADFEGDYKDLKILETPEGAPSSVLVPPDIGICDDCRRELLDPKDPRHLHPFISCTNCGPRLSIIRRLPYDRHTISQGDFDLCDRCRNEYVNPLDRRYHAQTIACPDCGPTVFMGELRGQEAILGARRSLLAGEIVAIKGIGGFHLACIATNEASVNALRMLKNRGNEPMAVMCFDIIQVRGQAEIGLCEEQSLSSWRKPVVLCKKSNNYSLAPSVAPGTDKIGIFLPYTPLHVLLLDGLPPVVLTSANLHEEPIIADGAKNLMVTKVLDNDREIVVPIDDSVTRCFKGKQQLFRRARGFVPETLPIPKGPSILALGGQMKNTFTFAYDGKAMVSHHIGEMGNAATFARFAESLCLFRELFGFKEEYCAHDAHPSYTTTIHREELSKSGKFLPVFHHHAHIASVMGEHGLDGRVIGVAADGTGSGTDGTIWGFEFLVASRSEFERIGHLRTFPLPGGEIAIKDCRRILFSLARQAGSKIDLDIGPQERELWGAMIDKGINAPATSSLGRLFDGFAVLAGLGQKATYEAELAVALESAYDPGARPFNFPVRDFGDHFEVDWTVALKQGIENPASISGGFHKGISEAIVKGCLFARQKTGLKRICLSGGCFLNLILLELVFDALSSEGFEVYTNISLPPGDGCVSFGQAVVALSRVGGMRCV